MPLTPSSPKVNKQCTGEHEHRQWIELVAASRENCLRVMSWNVLHQGLCMDNNSKYVSPLEHAGLAWEHRLRLIVDEIGRHLPDAIALQEVGTQVEPTDSKHRPNPDMFGDLTIQLAALGYSGLHAAHINSSAVFWRRPFRLKASQLSNTWGNRRAVAVVLESSAGGHVTFVSMHAGWRGEEQVRINEVTHALEIAARARNAAGLSPQQAPLVMCGDFNTSPDKLTVNACRSEGPRVFDWLTKGTPGLREVYTANHEVAFQWQGPCPLTDPVASSDIENAAGKSRFTYCRGGEPMRDYEVMDFVFHSPCLTPVGLLQMDRGAVLQGRRAIPHSGFPSDHTPLVCDLMLTGFQFSQGVEQCFTGANFPGDDSVLKVIDEAISQGKSPGEVGRALNGLGHGKFFVQISDGDVARQHGGCWGAEGRSAFFWYNNKSWLVFNFST